MGCDIHAAIETNDGTGWKAATFKNRWHGKWEDEPEETPRLDFHRDYDAFAILADVRNGYGFAGCDTGDGFAYISKDRGLPEDISEAARDLACTGDHSDTFVTLEEILAFDWTRTTIKRGFVNAAQYADLAWQRKWDKGAAPKGYCGGVGGGQTEIVEQSTMQERLSTIVGESEPSMYSKKSEEFAAKYPHTYCQVEWSESYSVASGQLWREFVPLMLKLAQGGKRVRMVMNFDS